MTTTKGMRHQKQLLLSSSTFLSSWPSQPKLWTETARYCFTAELLNPNRALGGCVASVSSYTEATLRSLANERSMLHASCNRQITSDAEVRGFNGSAKSQVACLALIRRAFPGRNVRCWNTISLLFRLGPMSEFFLRSEGTPSRRQEFGFQSDDRVT
jgi:hypothetical protein